MQNHKPFSRQDAWAQRIYFLSYLWVFAALGAHIDFGLVRFAF